MNNLDLDGLDKPFEIDFPQIILNNEELLYLEKMLESPPIEGFFEDTPEIFIPNQEGIIDLREKDEPNKISSNGIICLNDFIPKPFPKSRCQKKRSKNKEIRRQIHEEIIDLYCYEKTVE